MPVFAPRSDNDGLATGAGMSPGTLIQLAEIEAAVVWIAREGRMVAEPSGAVSVAAALRDSDPAHAVALVSGGNVDPARYAAQLAKGAGG